MDHALGTNRHRGWHDLPRSGRPPIYTDHEIRQLHTLIYAEPRQIQQTQAHQGHATSKSSSTSTLQRGLQNCSTRGVSTACQ